MTAAILNLAPLKLTMSCDVSQFETSLREFALLLEASEQIVPGLINLPHVISQLCVVERDDLSAPLADECRFTLKPSERFLMLMAAARAGKVDLGIVEYLFGHDCSSVGCVDTTNEGRAPGESQGSSGECPRNPQVRP